MLSDCLSEVCSAFRIGVLVEGGGGTRVRHVGATSVGHGGPPPASLSRKQSPMDEKFVLALIKLILLFAVTCLVVVRVHSTDLPAALAVLQLR